MKKKLKKLKRNFKRITNKPEMKILPGQLAYFLVMAVIPTLTLFSIGAVYLNLSTDVIYDFFASAFNSGVADLLLSSSANTTNHISVMIIVVIGYVVATKGAASIIITSNTIYGIKNVSSIQKYMKAFLMILIFIFLLILMLVGSMFDDNIISIVGSSIASENFTSAITFFLNILTEPFLWFILFMFIKVIYTIAPDKKINTKYTNVGSLFTSFAWILVTWIYSFYVNEIADYSALYGNLANLVILMLWFYFLAYTFTIGLALNYHKEEEDIFQTLVSNKN